MDWQGKLCNAIQSKIQNLKFKMFPKVCKMQRKIVAQLLIILCVFMIRPLVFSADAGANGLAFLKVDVDARAAAMAGAYTAISNDANSAFWNPAGLAGATGKSFTLMHHAGLADIAQEFAALHFYSGQHNLAVSFNVMSIPGIEIRGERPTNNPDGKVDALNFAAALSYATVIFSDWKFGVTAKYLYEKYYLEMAPGWAVDFGWQKRQIISNLDWGLAVQNIGRMTKLMNERTPLPLSVRSGLAWHIPYSVLGNNPLAAAEVQYINKEDIYYRLGMEQVLATYLSVRGGMIYGAGQWRWTAGLGLNYRSYHFDYAFTPYQYDLGQSHRFSVGLSF